MKDATTPRCAMDTANTLTLDPVWLDGERICRHVAFTAQHPAQLFNWLRERYQRSDKTPVGSGASLCVCSVPATPHDEYGEWPARADAQGWVAEVNGSERHRYTPAEGRRLDHALHSKPRRRSRHPRSTCIRRSMHDRYRRGSRAPRSKCFAGEVWTTAKARWHPDDFVKAPPQTPRSGCRPSQACAGCSPTTSSGI